MTAAAVNILNHLMNTIHTSYWDRKKKVYVNRDLQKIWDKVTESNSKIKDIVSSFNVKKVSQSLTRDLALEIGQDQDTKLKLKNA